MVKLILPDGFDPSGLKAEQEDCWLAFLERLEDEFGARKFKTTDVAAKCLQPGHPLRETLPYWLPADDVAKFRQLLGQQFHSCYGKPLGDERLYLTKAGRVRGSVQSWVIRRGVHDDSSK